MHLGDVECSRERLTEVAVAHARRQVVARGEIAEQEGMELTGDDVDALADEVVLGVGRDEPCGAERLVERCLLPGTFAKVDPLRYVSVSLKTAVRHAVQAHIGDVQPGQEVRRIADELELPKDRPLNEEEVALVIKAYVARHPKVRFGYQQAAKAPGLRTGAAGQLGDVVSMRHEPQPSAPDIAEDTVSRLSVAQSMALILERCRAEGGALLADVAQVWLTSEANDGSLAAQWVASQVHHNYRTMSQLIAQVRRIAAQVMARQAA